MGSLEFSPPQEGVRARAWLGGVLTLLAVLGVVWVALLMWMPTGIAYSVRDGELTITTTVTLIHSTRTVPLGAVTGVREVLLEGGRRVMGTALPGYCQGRFSYPNIGPVWQATDCSRRALLLQVAGEERPILITPPDLESFERALQQGGSCDVRLGSRREPDAVMRVMRVVALLLLVPVVLLPVLFFVAPGRLRYRVEPGALLVDTWCAHKRFSIYGATVTRVENVRAMKLAGSAMPGYYTGWFRVDGVNTRVYATTLRSCVLVRAERHVLVSPRDAEAFVAALVENGARPA